MPSLGSIFNKINRAFNEIPKAFKKLAEIGDFLKKFEKKTIGQFTKIFQKIKDYVNIITNYARNIGRAFEKIGSGIFKEIYKSIPNGFKYMGLDLSEYLDYIRLFVFSYLKCFIHYVSNLRYCMMYYLFEIVGHILYLPVAIVIFLLYCGGLPSYTWEKQAWDLVETLDTYVYGLSSIHISHYPKNIRNKCYNCKRLKPNVLTKRAKVLNDDFKGPIKDILSDGIRETEEGVMDLYRLITGK